MGSQTPDTTIKKSQFTRGPLTAGGNGVHKGISCVAIAFDPEDGQRVTEVAQANARLFAAAPALYEACRNALDARVEYNGPCEHDDSEAKHCLQCELRAALALVDTTTERTTKC